MSWTFARRIGMQQRHFDENGFAKVADVLTAAECDALAIRASEAAQGPAGTRCLLSQPWCAGLVDRLRAHPQLSALLPVDGVATQCTGFEKSASRNWLVAIHQDLSIRVARRVDDASLQGWSDKEGALFVQPPVDLLERLVGVRIHLDDCAAQDGPLRVVPGSHRHGVIATGRARAMREAGGDVACLARRGDALVLRPLLLHASSKSSGHSRRRVLHFLFGPRELPLGLRWGQAV